MCVVAPNELHTYRQQWRREGMRVVLTNGVFDLLHSGHVRYLEQARSLGDILVVGINSDASTRKIKGPLRPLVPQDERAYLLAAIRWVDYVTVFDEPTAEALVRTLAPDVYVKGGDYAMATTEAAISLHQQVDETRLPEARVARAGGGRVVLVPYHPGLSTTALIERIAGRYGGKIEL